MNKAIFLLVTISLALSLNSCYKKGCTDELALNYNEKSKNDDGTCAYDTPQISLTFSHNFNGVDVTPSVFNQLNFTNAHGELMSFTKLQYSISNIHFYLKNGDIVYLNGTYHLVDLDDINTLTYILPDIEAYIGVNDYRARFASVGFTYGFKSSDNVSDKYSDLDALGWGCPDSLGGGYYQLKIEGEFIDTLSGVSEYKFYNSSANRLDGWYFSSCSRTITLDESEFDLIGPTTIEIKMNVANWFAEPHAWDLNEYNHTMQTTDLGFQSAISDNSFNVFSVGTITQ